MMIFPIPSNLPKNNGSTNLHKPSTKIMTTTSQCTILHFKSHPIRKLKTIDCQPQLSLNNQVISIYVIMMYIQEINPNLSISEIYRTVITAIAFHSEPHILHKPHHKTYVIGNAPTRTNLSYNGIACCLGNLGQRRLPLVKHMGRSTFRKVP